MYTRHISHNVPDMLRHHRHSISQLEEIERSPRWRTVRDDETYSNIIQDGRHAMLPFLSVGSSIYSRRHSATENPNPLLSILPPPLPQPPAVPKRLHTPISAAQSFMEGYRPRIAIRDVPPPLPPRKPRTTVNIRDNPFHFIEERRPGFKIVPPVPARLNRSTIPGDLTPQSFSKFQPSITKQILERSAGINENRYAQPLYANLPKRPIRQDAICSPKSIQGRHCYDFRQDSVASAKSIPGQRHYDVPRSSVRQDSSISSDSNSSPSYISKSMETPLIPPRQFKLTKEATTVSDGNTTCSSSLTKSVSTPAGLQAVVKHHNGSNMTFHHRIIREVGRSSSLQYARNLRIKFGLLQVVTNAIVLLSIGCGLALYFKSYTPDMHGPSNGPSTVVANNSGALVPKHYHPKLVKPKFTINPAPGICLPVIVDLCLNNKMPYNFTVFPNFMGQFAQPDARLELENYDSIIDVRCYELSVLFLCSLYVPQCGPNGAVTRPCRSLCTETKRRCGFFFEIFGVEMPPYVVECDIFPESPDGDACVGHNEVREVKLRELRPTCTRAFQCDIRRCIPMDWRCDGHVDCKDQTDELNCEFCEKDMMHCGERKCITEKHMCDGKVDCPMAQDERNCLRLSKRNGNIGLGTLEIFRPEIQKWIPACINHWDQDYSGVEICSLLGYANSNESRLMLGKDMNSLSIDNYRPRNIYEAQHYKRSLNLLHEFASCSGTSYPTAEVTCTNYMCGKIRKSVAEHKQLRIVGGVRSKPGDWPFLAALLGGPEEIFYCAGVLISDQWVLSAAHCAGNNTSVAGRTIQLGITRRHAHAYYGQKMKVKKVIPHPSYSFGISHDNDVALFKLSSRVTFHEHLIPVCLPPANLKLAPGTMCTVIGWGKKEDSGATHYANEIHEVEVPVLNHKQCNSWLHKHELNITDGMLCAGYEEGGKDACQGDSGGPLLCRDKNDYQRWFVGGIVSWGIKCAHPSLPGVYAEVAKYIPWIQQQMEIHSH